MPDLSPDQFQPPTPLQEHPEGHWGRKGPQPGKQGELVSGGRTQPWPRGYSPERRREVTEAMPKTSLGEVDRVLSGNQRAGVHQITSDMAARSSAPVSDLEGLKRVAWDLNPGGATAGTYSKVPYFGPGGGGGQIRMNPGRGSLMPQPDDLMSQTFTHELGHHRSQFHDENPIDFQQPETIGAEEARADRYGRAHYQGKDEYRTPYPHRSYWDPESSQHKEFGEGYRSETRRLDPQPARQPMTWTLPMVNVQGSEPLYRDPNSGEWNLEDFKRRRAGR